MSEWRTSHWQHIWQTNNINQTSSLSCVIKAHTQKSKRGFIFHFELCTFWNTKAQSTILLCSSVTSIFKECSSNFANFSFGLRFRLMHFCSSTATYGWNWKCDARQSKSAPEKKTTRHVFSLKNMRKDPPARCALSKPSFQRSRIIARALKMACTLW